MKIIELEIGANSLNEGDYYTKRDWDFLAAKIREFQEKAYEKGIDLQISVYDSFAHPFAGGRVPHLKYDELFSLFKSLQNAEIPFTLALNGGMPEGMEMDTKLHDFLLEMAEGKQKNSVVLGNHDLFVEIKNRYGNTLETIASCIQFAGYFGEEYENRLQRAFDNYDVVVFDNPGATRESLEQYSRYAEKIMLFLNSRCSKNMLLCKKHYEALHELNIQASQGKDIRILAKDIYTRFDGKTPQICEKEEAKLIHPNNRQLLSWALESSVYRYKIAREAIGGSGNPLAKTINTFLNCVH